MCGRRMGAAVRKVIDKVIDWPHLEKRRIMRWLSSLPQLRKRLAGHSILHIQNQFMLEDVLRELRAKPLPGYPSLDDAMLLPTERDEYRRHHRRIDAEDRNIEAGDPLLLEVARAPMVFVRSRVFNLEGIGTYWFLAYRDGAQFGAFREKYDASVRRLMRRRDRMFDLATGTWLPKPETRLEDVVLPPGMADDIVANSLGLFGMREHYIRLSVPWRRGVILAGPPGTGKTMFLKALAGICPHPFCLIRIENETKDHAVRSMFRVAAKFAPCVLVIEDLDRIHDTNINLSTFLNAMDGLEEADGLLTIATTNRPEAIDPALLARPARFDRKYLFGLPKARERAVLLGRLGGGRFAAEAIDGANARMEGFSMAGVRETVLSALYFAAAERREPKDADLGRAVGKMAREMRRSRNGMAEDAGAAGFGKGGDEEEDFIVKSQGLPGDGAEEWK